jgi:hypothetical protein
MSKRWRAENKYMERKKYDRDDWAFVLKVLKVLRVLQNKEVTVEDDVGMSKNQFSWMN